MFKQENLESLFKNTSPQILQQYFHQKNLLSDVDFEELKEKGFDKKEEKQKKKGAREKKKDFVKYLIDFINEIEDKNFKSVIEIELQKVLLMKNPKTITEFLRDGDLNDDILLKLKDANNFDQSLILFLEDKKRFDEFYFVYDASKNGYWGSARTDYVLKNQGLTDDIIENLVNNVKDALKKENKGDKIVKKVVNLGDKTYIFAFYQDSVHEDLKIENDEIKTIFSDAVGKAVFLYDKKNGFVKTFGQDKTIRRKMHKAFAKEVFKQEDIEEDQPKNDVCNIDYALNQLISNKEIKFNIKNDKIKNIFPISARFQLKSGEQIDLMAGENKGEPNNFYQTLIKFFDIEEGSKNTISIEDAKLLWLGFMVYYQDNIDNKKIATTKPKLTNNNSISGLGEKEIDFDILECFREAKILKNKEESEA